MAVIQIILFVLVVLLSVLCEVEARTYYSASGIAVGTIVVIVLCVVVGLCSICVLLVRCLLFKNRPGRVINPNPAQMVFVQSYNQGQTGSTLPQGGGPQNAWGSGNAKVPQAPPYSGPTAAPPSYLDPAYPPVNAGTSTAQQQAGATSTPRKMSTPRNPTPAGSSRQSRVPPPATSASRRSSAAAPPASGMTPSAPHRAGTPPATAASSARPQSVAPPKHGFNSIASPWN